MNDLDDVIEEVRFAASELPPDDMLHDELRFLVELSDARARLAHEQATNSNLLRALAEANDLNVVRRTAMVNLHEHIEGLQARLAEAERIISKLVHDWDGEPDDIGDAQQWLTVSASVH